MPPEELSEVRHALTLQRLAVTVKLTNNHLAAEADDRLQGGDA